MFTEQKQRLWRLTFVALAFMVALLYDLLVFEQWPGLGFVVFVVAVLAGFFGLAFAGGHIRTRWPIFLLVPISVLTFDVLLYNNILVHNLVPLAVYILVLLLVILVTLRPSQKPFYFKNIPLVKSIDAPFLQWGSIFRDLFRSGATQRSSLYKKIAISLIIAAPLLIVFGALFASADAVFAHWLGRIIDVQVNIDPLTLWRILRTIALTLIFAGIFYVVIGEAHAVGDGLLLPRKQDATVVGIVLGLVNALFLLFVFIQITYLFGSANYVLANNLTYAEYARRGFFELVTVMVITGLLLLTTYRASAHHGAVKFVQFLKLLLIAQVLVIALSALKRMNVYQEAYGFTTLRLYVEWFIYFVAFGLLALGGAVARNWPFKKFFYGLLVYGLCAFTIVATINVDALIARKNITQAVAQSKELDTDYLYSLSLDVMPELVRAYRLSVEHRVFLGYNHSDEERASEETTAITSAQFAERIKSFARGRLDAYIHSWRDFNIGANRAAQLLTTF